MNGPLAQLVAHLHDAQGVRGSSPLRPTTLTRDFHLVSTIRYARTNAGTANSAALRRVWWSVSALTGAALLFAGCSSGINRGSATSNSGDATRQLALERLARRMPVPLRDKMRRCGPVITANYEPASDGQPTFLNVGEDYPNPGRFAVVIWGENRSAFSPPPEVACGAQSICDGPGADLPGNPRDHFHIAQPDLRRQSGLKSHEGTENWGSDPVRHFRASPSSSRTSKEEVVFRLARPQRARLSSRSGRQSCGVGPSKKDL